LQSQAILQSQYNLLWIWKKYNTCDKYQLWFRRVKQILNLVSHRDRRSASYSIECTNLPIIQTMLYLVDHQVLSLFYELLM